SVGCGRGRVVTRRTIQVLDGMLQFRFHTIFGGPERRFAIVWTVASAAAAAAATPTAHAIAIAFAGLAAFRTGLWRAEAFFFGCARIVVFVGDHMLWNSVMRERGGAFAR